ncbi:MAG TPA: laccase domain-containing protein [Candidatus Saccharimonadales bacterium]|nr:laccase domain-containing protein [Candidatus Saccharimonadales bacterium]
MIAGDQPKIFADNVVAAVSSRNDGNMSFSKGDHAKTVQNRVIFLKKTDIDPEHTTLVRVTYENVEHFARYKIISDVDKAEGMLDATSELVADALVVTKPGHALFLPLADCVGAIIYDSKQHILMVSHLGRHSTEQQGATKSIQYFIDQFDTDTNDMKVWLSPAVGQETYPLKTLNDSSLQDAILEQLLTANIPRQNIELSDIDTATNENYFSHSQFLAGNREEDGRFAIVAMMHE